jgi:MSHA biogenesis protein MshQ
MDGAVGSELAPLPLPLRTEYYDDATWRVNDGDSCSGLSLSGEVSLIASSGDSGNGADVVRIGAGTTAVQEPGPIALSSGRGTMTFSAPGDTGWVDARALLGAEWPFLRDDLDDDGAFDDDPSARASFGLFDGNENRILLQEIPPR